MKDTHLAADKHIAHHPAKRSSGHPTQARDAPANAPRRSARAYPNDRKRANARRIGPPQHRVVIDGLVECDERGRCRRGSEAKVLGLGHPKRAHRQ